MWPRRLARFAGGAWLHQRWVDTLWGGGGGGEAGGGGGVVVVVVVGAAQSQENKNKRFQSAASHSERWASSHRTPAEPSRSPHNHLQPRDTHWPPARAGPAVVGHKQPAGPGPHSAPLMENY